MAITPPPYTGSPRVHIALAVTDPDAAIPFYRTLLGCEPSKRRDGYVKFAPDSPPVNLTLNRAADPVPPALPAHYGVEVGSAATYDAMRERLAAAGLIDSQLSGTTCCHAVQDKVWAIDPDGHRWELFRVTVADAPSSAACTTEGACGPEAAACCDTPAEGRSACC